jgi:cell division protein FtsX
MVVPKKWILMMMTTVVLSICMVFVLTLYLGAKTVHQMTQEAQRNVKLEIFFKEDLGDEELRWIDSLKTKFEIQEISLVSKAQAQSLFVELMKADWGAMAEDEQLLKSLPSSAIIQFHDELKSETLNSVTQKVVNEANQFLNYDSYIFQKDWAQWLATYKKFISEISYGFGLFIALLIFLIVSNLNRSLIFQNLKEIEVYHLIGATDWQIARPFMIRAINIGLVSIVISMGLTVALRKLILLKANEIVPSEKIASLGMIEFFVIAALMILLCGLSAKICVKDQIK